MANAYHIAYRSIYFINKQAKRKKQLSLNNRGSYLHLFYQVVVHCTFAFLKVACSPSAVANCIVTPVPHCPVMVALEGICASPQCAAGPCESSVPVVVNESPVICTLSKVPVFVKPGPTNTSNCPC